MPKKKGQMMSNQASSLQKASIRAETLRLSTTLRPVPVAEFVDRVGEKRTIQVGHNRRLRIKNQEDSLTMLLSSSSSCLIGQKIRDERRKQGIGATEFARRMGITQGAIKQQVYHLEKCRRLHGTKTGMLLAVSLALNIPPAKLFPDMKEILSHVEEALDWKDQKLGFIRFNILNEWRARYGLAPLSNKYLYQPEVSSIVADEIKEL